MARKRKRKANLTPAERPTDARAARNEFRSAGMAHRVVPMIETLRKTNRITQAQYDKLAHYREQAHQAEDDTRQSGTLDAEKIMGGGGSSMGGKIPAIMLGTAAILETARIEAALGAYRALVQAVARDDKSLTQWCVELHGGRERYGPDGKFVEMVPVREKTVVREALEQLRKAARLF